MENISVSCLNVDKAIKGNLLTSGVSNLAELEQKNLHKLDSDLTHEEIEKLRSLTEEVKAIEDHWTDFLTTGSKKTIEKREAVFLTKNLQPSNSEYQEDYFLDEVFGCGEITEVVGPTGCGKTQIAMQLWLNVQTPKFLGGQEGEALFIDTNGDFMIDRLNEMAKWYKMKLMKCFNKDKELEEKYKKEFTEDKILERIYHYRMLDEEDQTKLIYSFEKILKTNPKIKLIVFDTVNVYCKTNDDNYGEKKRILNNILVNLHKLAKSYGIWVVLVNILKSAYRYNNRDQEQANKMEPVFGEALFQCVTNRVHIDRDSKLGNDVFQAHLVKGSIFYQRNASFDMHFQIKESGVSSRID